MEQAIKIAIEQGYGSYTGSKWEVKEGSIRKHTHQCTYVAEVRTDDELNNGEPWYRWHVLDNFLLDPLFWQALGKGLGWSELNTQNRSPVGQYEAGSWFYHWHRFIDHLAERKDIDSFFLKLLLPQPCPHCVEGVAHHHKEK